MDFFGIGPGEVLVIIIVALLVFGPERLADIGKTLGKTIHDFRKAASDLTTQVNKEIEEEKATLKLDDEEKAITKLQGEDKGVTSPSSEGKDVTQPKGGDDS